MRRNLAAHMPPPRSLCVPVGPGAVVNAASPVPVATRGLNKCPSTATVLHEAEVRHMAFKSPLVFPSLRLGATRCTYRAVRLAIRSCFSCQAPLNEAGIVRHRVTRISNKRPSEISVPRHACTLLLCMSDVHDPP
ncbi:hypothetical protein TraAM80_01390 [Trypanosoma rangeli]|uniref:Uncharacterized protein n=1 Tax=Trypanosoma rangeli TaxID=5698 RepID=A0A422NYX9_TRYRA|nr:uncharacterized protein TraAM80_01390 [Trypanosoma rangeli]RNF10687.1 hypothetical protein TraAM80_01390 [Trypanosoma rangeli]|eukprot:RNF10687.1 hypothetical protein TraAM80_01390 [Trypanosoma rangeli]